MRIPVPRSDVRKKDAILAACRRNRVRYHHHDSFRSPSDGYGYNGSDHDVDLRSAVVVVYSSPMGPWSMAINEDGSISRPGDTIRKKMLAMKRRCQALAAMMQGIEAKRRYVAEIRKRMAKLRSRIRRHGA